MNNSDLAKAIVAEIYGSANTYLYICAVIVLSGVAAWGLRYLERKAENYVTREDFMQLQRQLETSTRLVEGIKAEVQHTDWARREWFAIRSSKLEILLETVNSLAFTADNAPLAALDNHLDLDKRLFDKAISLSLLYFPELFDEVNDFVHECVGCMKHWAQAVYDESQGTKVDWREWSRQGEFPEKIQLKLARVHAASAKLLQQSAIDAGLIN